MARGIEREGTAFGDALITALVRSGGIVAPPPPQLITIAGAGGPTGTSHMGGAAAGAGGIIRGNSLPAGANVAHSAATGAGAKGRGGAGQGAAPSPALQIPPLAFESNFEGGNLRAAVQVRGGSLLRAFRGASAVQVWNEQGGQGNLRVAVQVRGAGVREDQRAASGDVTIGTCPHSRFIHVSCIKSSTMHFHPLPLCRCMTTSMTCSLPLTSMTGVMEATCASGEWGCTLRLLFSFLEACTACFGQGWPLNLGHPCCAALTLAHQKRSASSCKPPTQCAAPVLTRRFYFGLSGVVPGVAYKFNIVNFRKKISLFATGKQPLVCRAIPSAQASATTPSSLSISAGSGRLVSAGPLSPGRSTLVGVRCIIPVAS